MGGAESEHHKPRGFGRHRQHPQAVEWEEGASLGGGRCIGRGGPKSLGGARSEHAGSGSAHLQPKGDGRHGQLTQHQQERMGMGEDVEEEEEMPAAALVTARWASAGGSSGNGKLEGRGERR